MQIPSSMVLSCSFFQEADLCNKGHSTSSQPKGFLENASVQINNSSMLFLQSMHFFDDLDTLRPPGFTRIDNEQWLHSIPGISCSQVLCYLTLSSCSLIEQSCKIINIICVLRNIAWFGFLELIDMIWSRTLSTFGGRGTNYFYQFSLVISDKCYSLNSLNNCLCNSVDTS